MNHGNFWSDDEHRQKDARALACLYALHSLLFKREARRRKRQERKWSSEAWKNRKVK